MLETIIFGFCIIFFVLLTLPPPSCDDVEQTRPKLKGEDLKQWTEIYKSLAVFYQHSMLSENSLTDIAWNRWSDLTGKQEWEENNE